MQSTLCLWSLPRSALSEGTDKATGSRDDLYKKDHAIVLEKLRKRTNVQIRAMSKTSQKKKWLCIARIAQSNFEFICTVSHSA